MAKVVLPLLLLSAFLLVSSAAFQLKYWGLMPVEDVKNNMEVQALGRFSVEDFNKKLRRHNNGVGHGLLFSEVVEAQVHFLEGSTYFMKIAARSTETQEMAFYESV
ncbi:hypothetical protein P3X46_002551, partial [Hevea brasiliensis]